MARKRKTEREINDRVARDALRYGGGKSEQSPLHSSMVDDENDADTTDALDENDDGWDDEDNK